jgi:hypothetical protein
MPYLTNQYKLNFMKNLLLLFYCSSQRLSPDTFDIMKLPQEHRTHWKLNYTQLLKAILIMDTEDFILSIKRLMLIILWEWRNRFRHVFEKPNGTDPYIIQQGLHNDVVTILRKGLLQQRTYHSTTTFGSAAPMVSDAHSSPQRTVKWTDKDQVTHMEQWVPLLDFTKRKQIRF